MSKSAAELAASVPSEKILARAYTVMDSNADGRLTRKEIENSPFAKFIEFSSMNLNADGVVDRLEWNAYWEKKDGQMSNAEFKKFLLALVDECDVDLSDLAADQKELKARKRLAMVPADKLAARIYATLDVSGGGGPLKKEVMMGPLAESLSPYLSELDADANGRITVAEWNGFLATREKAFGGDAYSQWLRDVVWESDVDCSDLVSANVKAVEEIGKLGSDALLEKIWNTLDSDGSGAIERNELLYSSIKELLYKDWAELDADSSGRVTREEWNGFMKKMKHKKGENDFRKFLAYMVYEGDIDVSDLMVTQTIDTSEEERNCMGCSLM